LHVFDIVGFAGRRIDTFIGDTGFPNVELLAVLLRESDTRAKDLIWCSVRSSA
jgi:hypothetical protein